VTYPEVVPLGQVAAPAPLPRIKIARRSGIALKPAKPVGVTEIPERRSRRDIITITQLKFCKEVLDYIYRPEFETWAYPFMSPVGTLFPPFISCSLVGAILETCLPVIETHELNWNHRFAVVPDVYAICSASNGLNDDSRQARTQSVYESRRVLG
jgi:hypothetical protein